MTNEADVIVVGSGGGALVAACRAADRGLSVLLLERSQRLGGSTAVSGGVLWVPDHHLMAAAGFSDSKQAGIAYLRHGTDVSDDQIEWFVDTAPKATRYLTDETEVRLVAVPRPDYHPPWPGSGTGRSLDNLPYDVRAHNGLEAILREPTYFPPMTIIERDLWQGASPDTQLLKQRAEDGIRTLGGALIGALISSALARGVELRLGARARTLTSEGGRVTGIGLENAGGSSEIVTARRGVVLATGGFEWNLDLQKAFLPAPVTPTTPPHNEGDGLLMAMAEGAAVSEMSRVWGIPVLQAPDHFYDGAPSGRVANTEMTLPGSIVVNASGRRFVNEARDYHDLAKVFANRADGGGLANQPAWIVFDARYRRSYNFYGHPPGDTAPDWVTMAPNLRELADAISVDPEGLERTVSSFNIDAAKGVDTEFGRGSNQQDRHLGDKSWQPNASLAPLLEGPFFAAPVKAGTIGTLGGVVVDRDARVLRPNGEPIDGLFAAGNVAASVFGNTYPAAGATIISAVVRGYAAGGAVGS